MSKLKSEISYQVGEVYEFTVGTLHYDFCELIDSTGFRVYLKHTHGLNLSKGQKVRCKVTANYQARPKIELVDQDALSATKSRVTEEAVSAIITGIAKDWDCSSFTQLLLMNEVEDRSFESECRQWIATLSHTSADLQQVRADCTAFMEESDFLSLCAPGERDKYEHRLTVIIDFLGSYLQARQLIDEGKAAAFVDQLLDKLDKTGYIYHPEANFHVLSALFLLDKSLIEDNISRLFDIIRHWSIDIWDKEPFKDALLKTLELYVEKNIWRVDREGDNGRLVRNQIQALSIILLLADNKDNHITALPDERINLARLCVLSTYIDNFNNKELLGVAINSLVSDRYYRPAYGLADTAGDLVPFALKRCPAAATAWPVFNTSCYIDGTMRLVVSPEGLIVKSDDPKAKPVIPTQLGLWGKLQVYADRRDMPSLSGDITVKDSKRLWEAIEHDLIVAEASQQQATKTAAAHQQPAVKAIHSVGDTVTVNVVSVDEGTEGDNKAWCVIEGEQAVCGYVYGRDIVAYIHHVSLWMFQTPNGRPLALEAVIQEEDPDGMFHLSMLEPVKNFVCGRYNPGDTVICSLGVPRRAGASKNPFPAITPDGTSVSLTGSYAEPLGRGDLVRATYMGKAEGTFHVLCSLKDRYDGMKFEPARAFHNLMLNYAFEDEAPDDAPTAVDQPHESAMSSADFDTTDRILDASYVKEIIRILDRMAIIDADYVRSYNYIAYARLLCLMIGWGARADYYRGRKQLVEMLYDFAVNDTVDTSQLDRLQTENSKLFAVGTPLHEKFEQLRIISFMGNQAHDDDLMRLRATTQGINREMASLAMAYNILRENNMLPQANDILNHVKNELRLGGYESNLKVYGGGIESQTVEFKTSVVYPPDNNSYPDMNRQMKTILTVIAAFLNTDGGTLYIGANDSGAGVGVYDDLCYSEFNGNKDKYQRMVLDTIAITWGNNVASFVNADWDHDGTSGKDVLVVRVEPYERGVELDGEWFYRNGAGNRRLTKTEFEEYNERRRERMHAAPAATAAPVAATPATEEAPQTSQFALPDVFATQQPEPEATDKIKTSISRKNVLVDYAEGFRPYEACFKFLPHGKFCRLDSYDYDDTSLLTLPVYEEDVRDRYLVLGYEDGTVGKVPVRELMKSENRKEYTRYTGSPLLFAAIASDDDGLVSLTRESKTGERVMVRVDHLSGVDKCRLPDKGGRFYNEGIAQCSLAYEIAPATELPHVKSILDRDVRTLGLPLATSSADIKTWLEKWGINVNA